MAEVVFLIAILLAVYLFAGIWFASARARKYEQIAHVEATRSAWAEARGCLFELVRVGKLSPHSRTFQTLYRVQTFILRRPDAYDEISVQLREAMLAQPGHKPPHWVEEEQASWPNELGEVLTKMGAGIGLLIFGYPGWGRFLRVGKIVGRLLLPAMALKVREVMLGVIRRLGDWSRAARVERDLIDVRAQIESLAKPRRNSGAGRFQTA